MAISNTKLSGAEFFRKYSDIIKEAEEKEDKKPNEDKDTDSESEETDDGKKVMPWDKKKKK